MDPAMPIGPGSQGECPVGHPGPTGPTGDPGPEQTEQEKAAYIMGAVDSILAMARGEIQKFKNDAINWGDLRCVSVLFGREYDGPKAKHVDQVIKVHIEECSPYANQLQEYVREKMKSLHNIEVEVNMEW